MRGNQAGTTEPVPRAPPPAWVTVRGQAKARFGIARFRPGQREIIDAVLNGERRDVIGIMPTGAGKSLCYQLPSLFLPHATVVVSPLISLMQDQQEKRFLELTHAAGGQVMS